jgi:hypothetical protein
VLDTVGRNTSGEEGQEQAMISMQDVVRREKKLLNRLPIRLQNEVNKILEEMYGKLIYRLTPDNRLRLMTLWTWMDRYKVDMRFVLAAVVPYHLERIANGPKRKRKSNPKSLGFAVGTMVGKTSEKILQQAIERGFPNGENLSLWQWERMQEVMRKREKEAGEDATATRRQFESIGQYVKAYKRRVYAKRRDFEREQRRTANTRRHYRTNPWT